MKTDIGGEALQYEIFAGLIDERPTGFETGEEPEDYDGPETWIDEDQ